MDFIVCHCTSDGLVIVSEGMAKLIFHQTVFDKRWMKKNSLTSVWKWYSCWAVPQRNLQKQFSDHIFLTSGSKFMLSFTHIRVVVLDEYSVLFEGREDMNGPYVKLDEFCVCLFNGSGIFILSKKQSKQNIHGTCSCLCYFFRIRWPLSNA